METTGGRDDGAPAEVTRRDRVGARVALVDARDRILLVRLVDDGSVEVPDDPPAPTYWVTIGGGSEPGETLEQTARREVFEETGIGDLTLGPEIYVRRIDLVLRGEPIRSVEHIFAGWVDTAEPALHHLDPTEHGVLVEHRWWTLDELAAPGRETIYPRSIARVAADALAARDRHR